MKFNYKDFYFALNLLALSSNLRIAIIVDKSEFKTLSDKIDANGLSTSLYYEFKNQLLFNSTKTKFDFFHSVQSIGLRRSFDHVFFLKDVAEYEKYKPFTSKFLVSNI